MGKRRQQTGRGGQHSHRTPHAQSKPAVLQQIRAHITEGSSSSSLIVAPAESKTINNSMWYSIISRIIFMR